MSTLFAYSALFAFTNFFCSAIALAADPITICIGNTASPPFLFPNKEGTVQVLIRMAAEQQGLQVKFQPMLPTKCAEEIKAGTINSGAAMGFTAANQEYAAFPMKKPGEADTSKAVGAARSVVYRVKGSKADWNGSSFSEVKQGVLFAKGNSVFTEKLKALKVPFNDETATFQKNLLKMVAGQGELVIGFEHEGKLRMDEPEFAGKIEALPTPFTEAYYFMAFNKKYHEANAAQVDGLWAAIAKMRTSPAYLTAIKGIQ
ncbi:hypothetical protein ACO0LF_18485 [Undibacterium sp. Di27W]|uniref:hypothetical protein n=1 Tax=Undibacterium sp. Di27W TaxID=3413036 RepID=UPI003BF0184E